MTKRTNTAGLALIKSFEGLRLKSYRCPANIPTVGYGHTGPEVRDGMTITQAQADAYLAADLAKFEQAVSTLCPITTDNQFAALVSFAYNLGSGSIKDSTLRRMHNAGDYAGAAGQFGRWDKAAGKVLPGLTKRRAAEAALYGKGDA